MAWVERKLHYARCQIRRLKEAETGEDLFATLDAFLSEARSVLYVLAYQFGWKELRGSDRKKFAAEREQREESDKWFTESASPILKHPLTVERHEVIHKSGSPAFGYPLKGGHSKFYHTRQDGQRVDGLTGCRERLKLVEDVVEQAQETPWL
jgi:hypothetical protein